MSDRKDCNTTRQTNTSESDIASVPYVAFEAAMYQAELERKKKSRWMIAFFIAVTLLCSVVIGTIELDNNSTDSNEVNTYESAQFTCDSR